MAQTVGTEALRRLAFVAGGRGGAGVRRTDDVGPHVVWGRVPADASVDRADVPRGGGLHGTVEGGAMAARLPVIPTLVRQGRGGRGGSKRRGGNVRVLHELAGEAPEEAVPDGVVPAALPRFLRLVGMAEAEMAGALLWMEGGALRMVARVAKQRVIQVTRHWQTVGVPLELARDGALPHASHLSWVRR